MKKLIFILSFLFFTVGLFTTTAYAVSVNVMLDGQLVEAEGVIVDGRTLVPVRAISELLGGIVGWNEASRQVSIVQGNTNILLTIDNINAVVNNQNVQLDVPAQIRNNRTFVPLRFIGESFGLNIDFVNGVVMIYSDLPIEQPPTPSLNDRYTPFHYTTSSIILPNRRLTDTERQEWINEYIEMGGASAFELEVVRLINEIRAQHNLVALQIDMSLMHASRFYAQTLSNLNLPLGHREGPYGGSGETASAFGATWNAANGQAGRWTPQEAVQAWMDSPGHRANILNPNLRYIGMGSQLGGQWGVFHYSLKSNG